MRIPTILAVLVIALGCVPAQAVKLQETAPDFALPSDAGPNRRLLEQRGQVVMLNFWASWCGPCKREMPRLDRLYERFHAAGFQLWGVDVDEDPAHARQAIDQAHPHFPILFDSRQVVSRMYDLATMPSTLIIDRDGRVRYRHLGYQDGVEMQYESEIAELLRE